MVVSRRLWTEEETKLALFIYFQLPFGQLHSGNPEICKLASIIGRSNSSVAMKLCNFASLDPKIIESGRSGLQGASAQDRRIWSEFSGNWTTMIEEAEQVWNAHEIDADDDRSMLKEKVSTFVFEPYDGPSTAREITERRIGQDFFRRAVLANFENTCCITGIAEPALLNASHIMPWGVDVKNRHNPANGLCLSATLDRAFDRGLVTFNDAGAVLVAKSLITHTSSATRSFFSQYQGAAIGRSTRFNPDASFLTWHRNQIFVDR